MIYTKYLKTVLTSVLILASASVLAEGSGITILVNQLSNINSDTAIKQKAVDSEISDFKHRQLELKQMDEKNRVRSENGSVAWKNNIKKLEEILILQEWIDKNIVTKSGHVNSNHPEFKRYEGMRIEYSTVRDQLINEAAEVKAIAKAHIEEAKNLQAKKARIDAMNLEISQLESRKVNVENSLKNTKSVRTVVIETAILPPDPQTGMKSNQKIKIDFINKKASTSYKTGTTDFGDIKIGSIRNKFEIKNVIFHSNDRVTIEALGQTASGTGVLFDIDYSFLLDITSDGNLKVKGCHDAYPAYKVYIDDSLSYFFKHESYDLLKLYGTCDIVL